MKSLEGLVNRHLKQVLLDGGFEVTASVQFNIFDNAVISFHSGQCRLKVTRERGQMTVEVGPLWQPDGWDKGPWYDLDHLLACLKCIETPRRRDYRPRDPDGQLRDFEQDFRLYLARICKFFTPASFADRRGDLDAFVLEAQELELLDIWRRKEL